VVSEFGGGAGGRWRRSRSVVAGFVVRCDWLLWPAPVGCGILQDGGVQPEAGSLAPAIIR